MRIILSLLLIAIPLTAQAPASAPVCAPPVPPFLLPSEQDFSALKDPAQRHDVYDRLHYLPLAGDQHPDTYLSLTGHIREWYESYSAPTFGVLGPEDDDGYLLQRYMLQTDFHFGDRVRVFADWKANFENDRTGGPRPDIDADRLDLNQAFVEFTLIRRPRQRVTLRVGRQELFLGSGRFVDMREGPNVRRGFDGARATVCTPTWRVDVFALRPVENRIGIFDDVPAHATSYWGVYASRPLPVLPHSALDLYYMGFDQKQTVYASGPGRETRHTVGTRLSGQPGAWDYDSEAAFQWGSFANRNIRAWTVSTNTGRRFPQAFLTPRLGMKLDVASGDRDPRSGTLGTFNPLYPSLHYFGYEGIAGPSNFYDIRPEFELHPHRNVRLSLDTTWFWRHSDRDGIYLPGPILFVPGDQSRARYIGNKSAAEVEWAVAPHWTVNAYYSHFFTGRFLRESTPGRDFNYTAAWLTYRF